MQINVVHGDYFSDAIIKVIFKVIDRRKLGKLYNNMNFIKTTILTSPIYHSSRYLDNQIRTFLMDHKRKFFLDK